MTDRTAESRNELLQLIQGGCRECEVAGSCAALLAGDIDVGRISEEAAKYLFPVVVGQNCIGEKHSSGPPDCQFQKGPSQGHLTKTDAMRDLVLGSIGR